MSIKSAKKKFSKQDFLVPVHSRMGRQTQSTFIDLKIRKKEDVKATKFQP